MIIRTELNRWQKRVVYDLGESMNFNSHVVIKRKFVFQSRFLRIDIMWDNVILPNSNYIIQNTVPHGPSCDLCITHVVQERWDGCHLESSVSFLPYGLYIQIHVRKLFSSFYSALFLLKVNPMVSSFLNLFFN